MGFVGRLRRSHRKKNAKNITSNPGVILRSTKHKKRQPANSLRKVRGSSLHVAILAEEATTSAAFDKETNVTPACYDPTERQRLHLDRLKVIGHRHVNATLHGDINEIVPPNIPTTGAKKSPQTPYRNASFRRRDKNDKERDVDVREPFNFLEFLFRLTLCGCDITEGDTHEGPSDFEEEKEQMKHLEVKNLPLLERIPPTISFQDKTVTSWADDHVLLTEVGETASLDTSLLSRMRRFHRVRKSTAPQIVRVYVQAPKRVGSDLSSLTCNVSEF